MKILKIISIILLLLFSSLTSITYAESLKFSASTYEGEVKKGKAHGEGTFTFSDGSTYEGKVSKNRIHGKGKYIDSKGKIYEGKFNYGTLNLKIDKNTRFVIKIKPKTGFETYSEMKGTGSASSKWFKAVKNASGIYELTDEGKIALAMEIARGGAATSSGGSGC